MSDGADNDDRRIVEDLRTTLAEAIGDLYPRHWTGLDEAMEAIAHWLRAHRQGPLTHQLMVAERHVARLSLIDLLAQGALPSRGLLISPDTPPHHGPRVVDLGVEWWFSVADGATVDLWDDGAARPFHLINWAYGEIARCMFDAPPGTPEVFSHTPAFRPIVDVDGGFVPLEEARRRPPGLTIVAAVANVEVDAGGLFEKLGIRHRSEAIGARPRDQRARGGRPLNQVRIDRVRDLAGRLLLDKYGSITNLSNEIEAANDGKAGPLASLSARQIRDDLKRLFPEMKADHSPDDRVETAAARIGATTEKRR